MSVDEIGSEGIVIPFPRSHASSHASPTAAPGASVPETEPEARRPASGGAMEAPTSRGVETLFRSVYNTHLTLHSMADNKSRMMIQVDGLILSVLIAANTRVPGSLTPFDIGVAGITLVAAASISLVFAVLAARPRSERRNPRTGRPQAGTGGLLFFSEFSGMTRDEYVGRMNSLMREPAALYESMSSNLHAIGGMLERKYALLRVSYGALAVGVVLACLAQLGFGGPLGS